MESIYLNNYKEFSVKAKLFASQFHPCAILDSCEIKPQLNKGLYKLVIGIGGDEIHVSNAKKLDSLYSSWEINKSWIFGVLGYNLKNEIEKLSSLNNTCFGWPDLSFFIPNTIITVNWNDELTIEGIDADLVFDLINSYNSKENLINAISCSSDLLSDLNKDNHKDKVNKIKEEILNGNVYELNLCSRFLYENISVANAYQMYNELTKISPAPFSAYFSVNNKFVLSASPERFLTKNNHTLISQPIKGTRPRGKTNLEDETFKKDLTLHKKDQAENVMIVDLVRNDMARVAMVGSVKVDELFGIYSYSHVHQMVSTVSSELDSANNWMDAVKALFPMGSMTGAPKIAAMQLIEELELANREWYSGALGYIDPMGNVDFNVLIRSIFYDSLQNKLAYYSGGAITIDSDTDEEYNEMMVKAKAIDSLIKKYL